MPEWIDNLKAGDLVVLHWPRSYGPDSVLPVLRTTKSSVIVKADTQAQQELWFNKKNGCQWRAKSGFAPYCILEATTERIDGIRRVYLLREIRDMADQTGALDSVSNDDLEEIVKLMKGKK